MTGGAATIIVADAIISVSAVFALVFFAIFVPSFFDSKKRFHIIQAGMAAQKRAEDLFEVVM